MTLGLTCVAQQSIPIPHIVHDANGQARRRSHCLSSKFAFSRQTADMHDSSLHARRIMQIQACLLFELRPQLPSLVQSHVIPGKKCMIYVIVLLCPM